MKIVLCSVVLALWCHASSYGQGGTITADPNAQQLRLIWKVEGKPFVGGERIGIGIGGLGDIFGTGKSAWAVLYGSATEWRIYRNDSTNIAKDTMPVQTFKGYGPLPGHPTVGRFWNVQNSSVGFGTIFRDETDPNYPKDYYQLHLYRVGSGKLEDTPRAVYDGRIPYRGHAYLGEPSDVLVADLTGDGIDELVMAYSGRGVDTGVSRYPELWIYEGGPEFQLDSPTLIVKHPLMNGQVAVSVRTGDFDGDGHVDIAMARSHTDTRNHLTFYWGTGDIDDLGLPDHTRILPLTDSMPDARSALTALDCDGDDIADLAFERGRGQPSRQGVYLFRSAGRIGNARTRAYTMSDADGWFPAYTAHRAGGYLNDSSRRCDMLMLAQSGFSPGDPSTLYALSGGSAGPDSTYEAYGTSTAINLTEPIDDADGDGWDDLLCGNYSVNFNGGIAAIFAGGPYIPGPKVSGVEAIAGEGHERAISVWPNPVRDALHVAWRGDLKRMPSMFVVHDMLGREVARGEVESWRGAALWRCADAPNGMYLLSIFTVDDELLATVRIMKESTT